MNKSLQLLIYTLSCHEKFFFTTPQVFVQLMNGGIDLYGLCVVFSDTTSVYILPPFDLIHSCHLPSYGWLAGCWLS